MLLDLGGDVAVALETSLRPAPGRWVWRVAQDVLWDAAAGEKIDGDELFGPLRGVDTASVVVEVIAIRVTVGEVDRATSVGWLVGGVDVTVIRDYFPGEQFAGGDCADVCGV